MLLYKEGDTKEQGKELKWKFILGITGKNMETISYPRISGNFTSILKALNNLKNLEWVAIGTAEVSDMLPTSHKLLYCTQYRVENVYGAHI